MRGVLISIVLTLLRGVPTGPLHCTRPHIAHSQPSSQKLRQWREKLAQDGCTPAAINQFMVAANGYLEYMGAREFQVVDKLDAVADR